LATDSSELRKAILHNLIINEEYCRKVLPFLDNEYFSDQFERIILQEINSYYMKHNSPPQYQALKIEIEGRDDLTEGVYKELNAFVDTRVPEVPKVDWLVNKTEEWCQEKAIVNAVYKAVNVIGGDDKKTTMTQLPDMLREAISTSFDKTVGHDFIEDVEDRWEFYNKKEHKIPSGLEHMDYILNGGFPNKTLGVIMAGTGVGKSLFMCSISANLLEQGNNVLYVTMEMAEEKIAQRIDQNLLNLSPEELDTIGKDSFLKRFDSIKIKTRGRLIVKEFPTKSVHAGHFRALLKELELKKEFKPDLVCIDYLNICGAMGVSKQANSYEQVKATAEELRALAMEFNLPILTATQTNRQGFSDADVDITSVSESFGLPMTADYFFAMTTNDKLREEGLIRFSQLKNRYGDPADRRNWLLGVDYSRMRINDMADQPAHIDALNEAENTQKTDTKPIMDIQWN
jgi:replicative DNA helicase|tara:strand:- start:22139 stop:23512 length:1374 start_codon:yes stop_codon:yes gene_type:complete